MIDPSDRGLSLGDGLFETVLCEGGALRWLSDHLERLAHGCAALGLPGPDLALAETLIGEAASQLAGARGAVRLTVTAGLGGRGLDRPQAPVLQMFATAAASPAPGKAARLATSRVRRNEGSPVSRHKTLSYLDSVLARAEAHGADADEALMLNNRSELACAAAANLFWVDEAGRICTPALDCGVLAGITRGRVLKAAPQLGWDVLEVRVGPEALSTARGVFLSNSLIGLRAVSAVDGAAIPAWDGLDRLAAAIA